ncbi:MAG TPA: hypothetical protein VFG47_23250 [Geminicoccaceae bacterium]|nr:hypothetical protein [Geminicoccaceae bacterium]
MNAGEERAVGVDGGLSRRFTHPLGIANAVELRLGREDAGRCLDGHVRHRPDAIVGFGEARLHAETATFEVRAREIASPRPGDLLTVGGESFVVQGEPERRDPDRLVWTLDARPA